MLPNFLFKRLAHRLQPLILLTWGLLWALGSLAQTSVMGDKTQSHVVSTPQVKATLMAFAPKGIQAGQTLWLGLQLVHQAQWHTYWRNPGDSGLATALQWQLPQGITAAELIWPVPKKIPIGNLANFGYEGTTLLVAPFQIGKNFKPSGTETTVNVQLHANWLVCKQECIPQEGDFQLTLPLNAAIVMASAEFEKTIQQQPQKLPGDHTALISEDGRNLTLSLKALPSALQSGDWTVFPQTGNIVQNSAAPNIQLASLRSDANTHVSFKVSAERMDKPASMSWLMVQGKADAPTGLQWTFETPVKGQWQEFTDDSRNVSSTDVSNKFRIQNPIAATGVTWGLALLGALLGGIFLNLMPCVFPVLAIKLLSLTQYSDSPKEMKLSAWAFSFGVMVSFFLLGALMLGLRAAGSQMGWGFQLQSPWVVGSLAMLFAVMGLNLSGMFELGVFLPRSLAAYQWQNPRLNALGSGVFAVLIASPCTAPFMGASLGLAIGLPAWQALPIFMAMGLGMALPFLAVSMNTAWVRFLPRPGAWMQTFRQFMAFPMYATVIWLVWVLGQQVGLDGATGFLATLLSMAMLIWTLTLKGTLGRVMFCLTFVLWAACLWYWGPTWTQIAAPEIQSKVSSDVIRSSDNSPEKQVVWEAWSADKVAAARKAGQPVFIDFTAAWCVTCQFNKKTTFSDANLLAEFAQKNVALFRADWTRYDPAITQALNELGRNGVPVYAWYAPSQNVSLLSELPSVKEIQNFLREVKSSP